MPGLLYGRRIAVEVAGLVIRDLRIAFRVNRQADGSPPNGLVRVWNLKRENATLVRDHGAGIVVSAGYGENVGVVLDGTVERATPVRETVDRVTTIEVTGKVVSPAVLAGVTTRSYGRPVSLRTAITDVVSDLGLSLGSLDPVPADENLPGAWSWSGRSDSALTLLCRQVGLTWWDDDGVIRFSTFGRRDPGVPAIRLSRETGLVGSPSSTVRLVRRGGRRPSGRAAAIAQLTGEGAGTEPTVEEVESGTASSLLDHRARIGSRLDIESDTLTGEWVVVGLRHRGDNRRGSFVTDYSLRRP